MNIGKLEAIAILFRWEAAFEADDFLLMARLLGLTDEIVAGLTLEEVLQTMTVRLADIARIAGADLPRIES